MYAFRHSYCNLTFDRKKQVANTALIDVRCGIIFDIMSYHVVLLYFMIPCVISYCIILHMSISHILAII